MPPKNGKKNTKTVSEKEYTLLTLEELKVKELKYTNRLKELRKFLNFIDEALLEISSLNEKELLQDKWQNFVTCNPLPKPYIPSDIRLFYNKMQYLEKEKVQGSINWLLLVNERSLLTQNIYREDLTRRKLNTKMKENIGQEYNSYINDSLKNLHRIEYFLDNDIEVAKCPIHIFHDIVGRKLAIQEDIKDLIDRYTYRIISSEKAQMRSLNAITAEYCFNADNFQIHIWCLKNVALRISHLSEPRLLANFHSIKLLLQVPSKMLRENLVIRALHMDFDHFSENAKSYKQSITVSTENLNAGIVDLPDCLVNEWIMQLEVQEKKRNELIQIRMEYEEKMRQYEEQMEKKKGRNKNEKDTKSKLKIVKPTKEPLFIGNDVFPDTYEEFLVEEEKQYQNFIQTVYKPELLDLRSDEINLKKYFILGGIYQLYYVVKPLHYDMNSYNLTWHKKLGNLVVDKEVTIADSKHISESLQMPTTKRLTKRMSIFEAENFKLDTDAECPWFIVTIHLPEYLCYWDEPIACHFETTIEQKHEKIEELQMEPTEEIKTKKALKKIKVDQPTPTITKLQSTLVDDSSKTNLQAFSEAELQLSTPRDTATASFIIRTKRLTDSQRRSNASFFKGSLANSLLQKNSSKRTGISDKTDSLYINDFPLTATTLTKPQIRHMERHIVPRIISSYKFPQEIRQEEMEAYNKKPKGKGGKIIRQKNEDLQNKHSNRTFDFTTMQNKPERLFPAYPKVEPLNIVSHLRDDNINIGHEEPETFAQLLQIVSTIKKKYRLRVRQTMDLKNTTTEIKTYNKRIRQMQRKKELLAINSSMHTIRSTIISQRNTKRSTAKSLKEERKSKVSLVSKREEKETVERKKLITAEDSKSKYSFESDVLLNTSSSEILVRNETQQEEPAAKSYSQWTTKYILKSEFDRQNRKIILHTNRLGNFGFAFKRYEHFPFKYWNMEPSETDPENEVVFTLDTQYVRCVLYITANGIRGHVTEPTKTYVRNPKMYLIIENPLKDYKEFKKLFKEKHLNIFAEHDASFYIENGYFSEKHLSNEMHTYCCMSVHSTQMRFNFSQWNRLAKRRDIILHFQQYKDLAENLVEVRVTPGEAYFVDIQELCTEDLNDIKLDYNLTWRNIESYSDLHHLIVAMYPAATDLRCKNPKLICCIRDLLSEIRPLSFS
ncbi:hypothetical protein FF38_11843 [Lucilia cuprina]|uniref:CASC1 C-terminal domain-containing protein n=1 Tax=Lucilia cuprina TaxID=7375 RepID=A0A0L0BY57_LUCCU|nr:hypothetical protein FF38_11843 [Lucilia cuprina]